jgi:hypothetical protein
MPTDPMYLPVRVGAALADDCYGYTPDNMGDNISEKNPRYCELTALYWGWKNVEADYLGLAHYRRYFAAGHAKDRFDRILTGAQAERILSSCDIMVPEPRRYVIETIYDHYTHAHPAAPLDCALGLIRDQHPEQAPAVDAVMGRTWAYTFNMFLARRDVADAYCAWLFPILFEVEKRVDLATYDSYNARALGFVSERLLNVWIEAQGEGLRVHRQPVVNLEDEHWVRKGVRFLERKVRGSGESAAGNLASPSATMLDDDVCTTSVQRPSISDVCTAEPETTREPMKRA